MKKLLLCLALAAAGCTGNPDTGDGTTPGSGNNAGGYVGTWKGDAAGWSVSAVVTQSTQVGGNFYLDGSATTNKANCLPKGPLQGTITSAGRATLIISDSSNSSRQLTLSGTVSGNTFTGTFESQSESSACITPSTAITLTKQ